MPLRCMIPKWHSKSVGPLRTTRAFSLAALQFSTISVKALVPQPLVLPKPGLNQVHVYKTTKHCKARANGEVPVLASNKVRWICRGWVERNLCSQVTRPKRTHKLQCQMQMQNYERDAKLHCQCQTQRGIRLTTTKPEISSLHPPALT